jgi:metal-responsive CopG/Arc/MetJ family transcriptional regulator
VSSSGNIFLPEPLLSEIVNAARAEHRSADEVVADAVGVYLERQAWRNFVEGNERKAKARGFCEEDVERLIAETRAEDVQRNR